jgi:galactokinase
VFLNYIINPILFLQEDITAEKYPKNRDQLRRKRLAEVCQHAERFVGTESGGMDQAISMLGMFLF